MAVTREVATRRRRALVAGLVALVVVSAAIVVALGGSGGGTGPELRPFADGSDDPYAYTQARRADLERRAAAGLAHGLYVHSPGGIEATAARVARYRALVDASARDAGVNADMLEALILLESGGRPDAQASPSLDGAVGLTQILAQTASGMLGMTVDVGRSTRLTRAIAKGRRVRANEALRRRVDERFDPPKAIEATGRYLELALQDLGREDLAFESYHMGIGNLNQALSAYGAGDIPYAQLFFDSSPANHPAAWRKLASLGDDSATYLWRLLAARDVMRLYRSDPTRLRTLAAAQLAKNSAEEVLHPAATTPAFAGPTALAAAERHGRIVPLDAQQLAEAGLRIDPQMGDLASKIGQQRTRYRGLAPGALKVLLYLGTAVRQLGGTEPLNLTSTVRDQAYQRVLARGNPQATNAYSLHTTGWAFDIERRYRSPEQARAFQFALDRLQAMNRIAWLREPDAIHITVAGP